MGNSNDVSRGVRLEGVSKRIGDFEAVKNMDLEISDGEFFTMLGPSGCGKTTTLRVIAGFEQPTEGKVLIDGDDVAGQPAYKRPTIGFGLKRQKVNQLRHRSHLPALHLRRQPAI